MARSEIPMVINLRQNKIADYQMCVLSVLSLPLQSEHCKVVALFHVAYKVGYSLRHPFDERAGGRQSVLYVRHYSIASALCRD